MTEVLRLHASEIPDPSRRDIQVLALKPSNLRTKMNTQSENSTCSRKKFLPMEPFFCFSVLYLTVSDYKTALCIHPVTTKFYLPIPRPVEADLWCLARWTPFFFFFFFV